MSVFSWLDPYFAKVIAIAGTAFPPRATINFVSGATAADNAGTNSTDITIAGGGGSVPTGTGFTHIASHVQDAAAKLVDLSDATHVVPLGTAHQLVRVNAGATAHEAVTLATGPDFGASAVVHALQFEFEEYVDATAAPATLNNYNAHAGAGSIHFTGTGSNLLTITGIAAPPSGKATRLSITAPKGDYGVTLVDESGSSTAANRIRTSQSGNNTKWILDYSPSQQRWFEMVYPTT